jgi:type II secretory pathway predicted ATPase ExeA
MHHKQLLSLYGLKWNPFSAEIPDEALISNTMIDNFLWRIENLVLEGGFALITGEPGLGKSVVVRLLARHLQTIKDATIAECSRPQSNIGDFYRELGSLFGIALNYNSRWKTFQLLREQWKAHIESTLVRPVLLVDEAQEMNPLVLSEIRLLSSMRFDSKIVLTVVLSGDGRLADKFRLPELLPLGSRIRTRLTLEPYPKEHLLVMLTESLTRAGAPRLMSKELMNTLVEHALGYPRVMNTLANEILLLGAKREVSILDEQLFFDVLPLKKRA